MRSPRITVQRGSKPKRGKPSPTVPVESERTTLEAALRTNPDDVEAHLVYADWLQQAGDPHGELIVLQHQLATRPSKSLARAEARWFERNFAQLEDCKLEWRLGFIRSAKFLARGAFDRRLLALLRHPAARFLRTLELELEPTSSAGARRFAAGRIIGACREAAPLPLRELVLEMRAVPLEAHALAELLQASVIPELSRLRIACRSLGGKLTTAELPQLTSLELSASYSYDDPLLARAQSAALRTLVIHATLLSDAVVARLLDGTWPLERLGVFTELGSRKLIGQLTKARGFRALEAIGIEWDDEILDEDDHLELEELLAKLGPRELLPCPFWSAPTYYRVGQGLRDAGRFGEALSYFARCIELAPDDPDGWFEHGNVLDDLGRGPEAIASWHRTLEIDPKYWFAINNLIAHHRDAGDFARAVPLVNKYCKYQPEAPEAFHMRGQLQLELGRDPRVALERARVLYEQSDAADATFQLACVHQLLGDTERALALLATAVARAPKLRADAAKDRDFRGLGNDPRFRRLIEKP